jgi:hypothetical protein
MKYLLLYPLLLVSVLFSNEAQNLSSKSSMLQHRMGQVAMQQNQDVFVPIGKYLQQGDAEKLSAWFANNLELDILGTINDCSKIQATQIMKDFFSKYTPKSFTITHKSGNPPMKYAIGTLNAGGEKFRTTIFVKTQEKGNLIQQLRIEKEE